MDQYGKQFFRECFGRVRGGAPLSKAQMAARRAERHPAPAAAPRLIPTGTNIGALLAQVGVK